MNHFPDMERLTVKQIREYLSGHDAIIIPCGVVEQHGYHLPLNTDAYIARHLALEIGRTIKCLVAPTMYQSFSGGELPGTLNIAPATMSLVVGDLLVSLAAQGFKKMHLLLCHGGSENDRALDNVLKHLIRFNPLFADVLVTFIPVWKLDIDRLGYAKGFAEGDNHAGWVETSIMLHIAPDLVQMDELRVDRPELMAAMSEHPDNYLRAEKIVDDPLAVPRLRQREDMEVGVMGFPERASAALGKRIVDDLIDKGSQKIQALNGRADGQYKPVAFTAEANVLL